MNQTLSGIPHGVDVTGSVPVGRSLLLALAVNAAFSPSLQAQETDYSREAAPVMEEITVTARKRSESLIDVPDAVTAFSATQIEEAGLKTLRDFTQLTPNIMINQGSGTGYPNIMVRGLAQAQGGEAPLAVVVDGVQISHPAFINRDYGDVEQVEVLRGPQGSLYGRNAIGGAINITTAQPTNELEGRVKLSYGNADSIYINGALSGPIVEDKVLFRVAGTFEDSDGQLRNLTNGDYVDWGRSYFFNGKLVFNLTEDLTLDIRGNYGDDDVGGLSAEVVPNAGWDDFDPGYFVNDPQQEDDRELWDVSAKLEYTGENFAISSVTGYSDLKEIQTGDADFAAAHVLLQHVDLSIEAFTQELRISSTSPGRLRWLAGAFYQDRDTDNFLDIPFDDGSGRPVPGAFAIQSHDVGTSESWAVFGSVSYDIRPDIELTLGGRYDEDKRTSVDEIFAGSAVSDEFTAFQPKVQVAWKPAEDLNVYATYGEGFGSGGFNAFIAGPAARRYEEQTSENYELGIKGAIGVVSFSASVFRVFYEDQQLFFITTNPPSQNIVNIDETRVDGAELEVTARPVENLRLSAALGWTDAEIEEFAEDPTAEGNRTPQSYKYTFNFSAQYSHPLTAAMDLRAYGSYRRQSSQYWDAANTLETGAKDFINLRLFLETQHWSVGLFGENITDEQYPTQAAPNGVAPGVSLRIPSTRGVYGVEATYRF